jgi:hypothetical protein
MPAAAGAPPVRTRGRVAPAAAGPDGGGEDRSPPVLPSASGTPVGAAGSAAVGAPDEQAAAATRHAAAVSVATTRVKCTNVLCRT